MLYTVNKACTEHKLIGQWSSDFWAPIKSSEIKYYMGEEPDHKPKTEFKLAYDKKNIYVIFKVEDRYVKAVAKQNQESVCLDSCVEFFFAPSPDISEGYFNIEMNCGGTFLFNHQTAVNENRVYINESDCQKLRVYSSLPKIIDPEITTPTTWIAEYVLPIEVLEKYANVTKPAKDVIWCANFYKCADKTSHPHWLTWSKVDWPYPHFHKPEFFGTLKFV